ncbi:MAG: hypothetical protein DCC49_03735 [Acidobacteria bacterium]|nr:MAG: hypothetical protein DCC49_03735 [Acidobacteriota bacterium]
MAEWRKTLEEEGFGAGPQAIHYHLAGEFTEVEIGNFIDDYSRLCLASTALEVTTARDVVDVFRFAGEKWGLPAALLTDNGCVFTAWHRGGATVLEYELAQLGIEFRHSRIYHPQTCGKVERFHQTLKIFLQPMGRKPGPPKGRHRGPRNKKPPTML